MGNCVGKLGSFIRIKFKNQRTNCSSNFESQTDCTCSQQRSWYNSIPCRERHGNNDSSRFGYTTRNETPYSTMSPRPLHNAWSSSAISSPSNRAFTRNSGISAMIVYKNRENEHFKILKEDSDSS